MNDDYMNVFKPHSYMTPLNEQEKQKNDVGFTHPDLHRSITITERENPEVEPRQYRIRIQGLNSIRTTISSTHDEEPETSEIP